MHKQPRALLLRRLPEERLETHKKNCVGFQKVNCWMIRESPVSPTADPEKDASYMEPFLLKSYGDWGAEMRELETRLPGFRPWEAEKFYSHNDADTNWYYYVYGSPSNKGGRNRVASRCVGKPVNGDVAVVRSGPTHSNDYQVDFSRSELVATAEFYKTASPSQVFGEREKTRVFGMTGLSQYAQSTPHIVL